jgi:hypothetical protein
VGLGANRTRTGFVSGIENPEVCEHLSGLKIIKMSAGLIQRILTSAFYTINK